MPIVGNAITLGGGGGGGLIVDEYTFTPASQDGTLAVTLTRDAMPLRIEIVTSTSGTAVSSFALFEVISAYFCPTAETALNLKSARNGALICRNGANGNLSLSVAEQVNWTPGPANYATYRCSKTSAGYRLVAARPIANGRWLLGVTYTIRAYYAEAAA